MTLLYPPRMHGDARGSVDPKNNIYGTSKIAAMPALSNHMRQIANEPPLLLHAHHRNAVLNSILETAKYNAWQLFAAHVRTNHIHLVIKAEVSLEYALSTRMLPHALL